MKCRQAHGEVVDVYASRRPALAISLKRAPLGNGRILTAYSIGAPAPAIRALPPRREGDGDNIKVQMLRKALVAGQFLFAVCLAAL